MTDSVNRPHPQPGPVAFNGVCLVGAFQASRGILTLPVESQPWWAGVLGLGIITAGFAFIIGGWLYVQGEVDVEPEAIRVRRWLEVLAGRPGRLMPLDARTRSAIVLEDVRSLRLEHDGFARI